MAASIGLSEVRFLVFELLYLSYFASDFDQVCDRLHGFISAFVSDSLSFDVAFRFN